VQSGPSPFLFDLLRTAAIEFVVGRMGDTVAMDGFSFEQLYSEELAFVVRPAHPLAGTASSALDQIVQFQLLMPPVGAIIRPAVDALLIAGGVSRLQGEIETVSNSLGRAYVLASDAVWIISRSVVALDLKIGQLVQLGVDVRATLGPIGITTRTGATLSESARGFIEAVRETVREA
jgi:LysR family pca operon transcriptional activator